MEKESSLLEMLFEKAKDYLKSSIELAKLKAIEKFADILSSLVSSLILLLFISMFFMILNIGVALWIGEMLDKTYYGFFIVSGFYAFIGLLLCIFKNSWLKTPLSNSIITKALK